MMSGANSVKLWDLTLWSWSPICQDMPGSYQLLEMKCGHHAAHAYMLKSHACDLNSDSILTTFQAILKCQKFWSITVKKDLNFYSFFFFFLNVCVLQILTWDSAVLQDRPPMAHLWNSRGERLLLWQCLLIWGALFTPKAKHLGAEWWACLATLRRLPRIMAGRQRTLDQDSPPAQIQTGSWVIWGAHTRLSSQRSSFQGNVSLSPSTKESSFSPTWLRWNLDGQTCSLRTVCFVLALRLRAHRLTRARHCCGKIRLGQRTGVLLQSKHLLKLYQTGRMCGPGFKNNVFFYLAWSWDNRISDFKTRMQKCQFSPEISVHSIV